MKVSRKQVQQAVKNKADTVCGRLESPYVKSLFAPSEEALRQEAAKDEGDTSEEGSLSKVFRIPSRLLSCEKPSAWKVPLVDKDDAEFAGLLLYIDKNELTILKKDVKKKVYERKLLAALLDEDGLRVLQQWHALAPTEFAGNRAENVFSIRFIDTIRGKKTSLATSITVLYILNYFFFFIIFIVYLFI